MDGWDGDPHEVRGNQCGRSGREGGGGLLAALKEDALVFVECLLPPYGFTRPFSSTAASYFY